MDAVNPLRRCLLAAGLTTALGCQSNGLAPLPAARAQLPPDPVAPVRPAGPLPPPPGYTGIPGTVIGSPVPRDPAGSSGSSAARKPSDPANSPANPANVVGPSESSDPAVTTTGYSALPTGVSRTADLLKESIPQIKVVALVGATNLVTDQEVLEAVRQRLGELREYVGAARAAKEKELYEAELRRVIERELILDEMYARLKKAGRTAMIEEIKEFAARAADQNLRAIRKLYGATTEEEFLSILRAQGLTLPVIRRQFERQLMADEYVRSLLKEKGRTVGLADIRAYYDRHPDQFTAEDRVKWLDIFISFSRHPDPRAALEHARRVHARAAAGDDFVALVKQYDDGLASGSNGVGVGSKRGEIQPADVEPTVWTLKPGEVGPLIETPTGYHIVKVVERQYAGLRPFDTQVQSEIRDKLTRQYREAEYQRLVEDLWRKGPVRVIIDP